MDLLNFLDTKILFLLETNAANLFALLKTPWLKSAHGY